MQDSLRQINTCLQLCRNVVNAVRRWFQMERLERMQCITKVMQHIIGL